MAAENSFSIDSDLYARARPRYPEALIDWIAGQCGHRHAAWDCATGNGQTAIMLADHFDWVEATDISAQQLGEAFASGNIRYSIRAAESTDFPPASFDCITVAQALHWLDYERFWPEVRRVGKKDAFFCAWGYAWFDYHPEVDRVLISPLLELLEPFWASNNAILWRGYQSEDIRFPFDRIEAPSFSIRVEWTLGELLSYVRTWSAYKRAMTQPGMAVEIETLERRVMNRFPAERRLSLGTPLTVVAGKLP